MSGRGLGARAVLTLACTLALGVFSGRAGAADITVGIPNWPSAHATGQLIGTLIEDEYGLSVDYLEGEPAALFAAVEAGDVDIIPEIWLPNHRPFVRDLAEKKGLMSLVSRGIPAEQGLCTTKYTADHFGIHSVFDLVKPDVVQALDTNMDQRGEMWAGAPGWASTRIEKVRAKSYGYDQTMQLLEADERTAMAALDVAVAVDSPYVFYCYEPHHMFILHDIVRLDEPAYDPTKWNITHIDAPDYLDQSEAATAWGVSFIHMGYRKALDDEFPQIVSLLDNLDLDADTISEMTYALVVERQLPAEFASTWLEQNRSRVETWVH